MGTRKKKTERKREEKERQRRDTLLVQFLDDYGRPEPPQNVVSATADSQLNSLVTTLASEIVGMGAGTIIDIGCGQGALLARLATLSEFAGNSQVLYVGVDFPEHHDSVLLIARENRLNRRVEVLSLDEYACLWKTERDMPHPNAVILRNVVHELDIPQTATLFHNIADNLRHNETVIIQDLLVFPKAERGYACWTESAFKRFLQSCGFSIVVSCVIPSGSGNRWLNVLAKRSETPALSVEEIRERVVAERTEQWREWSSLGALQLEDDKLRDVRLAKIDFDLQYAGLTRQLRMADCTQVGELTQQQQTVLLRESFARQLSSVEPSTDTTLSFSLDTVRHFQDRKNSLDALESFLSGGYSITVIVGPPLMGKTELARQVLARFHHGRIPVLIDLRTTSTAWNVVEEILSVLGCMFSGESLMDLKNLPFQSISSQLEKFLKERMERLVVVFDHWERIIEPDGTLHDQELRRFIELLATAPHSKLIITSRRNPDISFVEKYRDVTPQPLVGRFPQGDSYVEHVLGTFLGWESYPPALIQAIDRHPLMTVLAARYLRNADREAATEKTFLDDLREHLRGAVLARIMGPESKSAIEMLSTLRIPVPRAMLESLTDQPSVAAAESDGLLYQVKDPRRDDLVGVLASLRVRTDLADDRGELEDAGEEDTEDGAAPESAEAMRHYEIADQYETVYRQDKNPKWLREMYFHRMAAGDVLAVRQFGAFFASELAAAAEYWFIHAKDYRNALWAFEKMKSFAHDTSHVRMRIASCRIRLGQRQEGEDEFRALRRQYPRALQIGSAYVDALLATRDFQAALILLEDMGFDMSSHAWTAGQYGRAYAGIQRHQDAIRAFECQLRLDKDEMVFRRLARAYHGYGDTDNESRIIRQGLARHPRSPQLRVAYGALLERIGRIEEAQRELERLFDVDPYNGWIILPLVKTLIRLDHVQDAVTLWRKSQGGLRPDFLRPSISAEISAANGRYEEAIRILRGSPFDDEHSGGQKLEIFFKWASSLSDDAERVAKAREGLMEAVNPAVMNNVPLLVSKAKLALLARDLDQSNELIEGLRHLNPGLRELTRLDAEFASVSGQTCAH